MKEQKVKEDLIKYLKNSPDERLWQAIRNWSGYDFIIKADAVRDPVKLQHTLWENEQDTFYIESNPSSQQEEKDK